MASVAMAIALSSVLWPLVALAMVLFSTTYCVALQKAIKRPGASVSSVLTHAVMMQSKPAGSRVQITVAPRGQRMFRSRL